MRVDPESNGPSSEQWVVIGRVVSGVKRASHFTQLDWVQAQCDQKAGFKPYPGTLNLEVSEESCRIVESLQKEACIRLVPPDPAFCEAKVLPVSAGDVRGVIIIPAEEVRVHGKTIVEVMAPCKLKEALSLKDGDQLVLVVEKTHGPNSST